MIIPFIVNINTQIYYDKWILQYKWRGWNYIVKLGMQWFMIQRSTVQNDLWLTVNSLKALIECLIGANCSVSWVCLHFGPCNQWKWRWMTTSLFVSEWAWGKTDSGKVFVFTTNFWLLKIEHLASPEYSVSDHCSQVVLSERTGWV